jgi:hypothetical protein
MQRIASAVPLRFVRAAPRWATDPHTRCVTGAAHGRFATDSDSRFAGLEPFHRLQIPGSAVLLKGLVAAGIISGARDPRWLSMSMVDAARQLVTSGLDPDRQADGSVRRSILMARRVVEGTFSGRSSSVGTREVDRAARYLFYEMLDASNARANPPGLRTRARAHARLPGRIPRRTPSSEPPHRLRSARTCVRARARF